MGSLPSSDSRPPSDPVRNLRGSSMNWFYLKVGQGCDVDCKWSGVYRKNATPGFFKCTQKGTVCVYESDSEGWIIKSAQQNPQESVSQAARGFSVSFSLSESGRVPACPLETETDAYTLRRIPTVTRGPPVAPCGCVVAHEGPRLLTSGVEFGCAGGITGT
uniref:Uncharacterized protein n=1 Tax=Chromera velia CCMP2878 TaxID=1169474 RepID=A0A0K6S7W2_9ALVE|eukprot:Cvel_21583.t2-p1 / transcript=Cvel_21583.t2 / gene=Cvel_21583 / organism=Chromera_velia_CCMP2878 / gene_product=hypothetical protein / transcript_product=hypothetical protein / location=Cvel_scaffold2037:17412-18317(+) / protein_length=160 / sequence_SO=supercontig / SO=protein_coding / is_pseudo=false